MYESEMHAATHIKSKMWWADFDKETCHISASSHQYESTRPMQTHTLYANTLTHKHSKQTAELHLLWDAHHFPLSSSWFCWLQGAAYRYAWTQHTPRQQGTHIVTGSEMASCSWLCDPRYRDDIHIITEHLLTLCTVYAHCNTHVLTSAPIRHFKGYCLVWSYCK